MPARPLRSSRLVPALVLAAVAGCGGLFGVDFTDAHAVGDGADGGQSPGADGNAPLGPGGEGGAATLDGDPFPEWTARAYGNIMVETSGDPTDGVDAASKYSSIEGYFSSTPAMCTTTTFGACDVAICPADFKPTYQSAGTVGVTGGAYALSAPAPTTTSGEGEEYIADNTGSLWSPGQTLSVTASGGAVPAFSVSIVGPGGLTVVAPQIAAAQDGGAMPVAVNTADDFTVAWTGAAYADVYVTVSGPITTEPDGGTVVPFIECLFNGAAGQAAIPAAALAQIGLGQGTMQVMAARTAIVKAASYVVGVSLERAAVITGAGASVSPYGIPIVLQ